MHRSYEVLPKLNDLFLQQLMPIESFQDLLILQPEWCLDLHEVQLVEQMKKKLHVLLFLFE